MKKLFCCMIYLSLSFLFFTFTCFHVSAETNTYKGKAGDQAFWKYHTKTQTLTISGTGSIDRTIKIKGHDIVTVRKIVIKEGITSIDSHRVFERVINENCTELSLPDSLRKLATGSFLWLELEKLVIPKHLKDLEPGALMCLGIRELSVSAENKYYMAKDQILFSRDQSTLIYYSGDREGDTYRIPSKTKVIAPLAFARNHHLKKVILHKNIKELGAGACFGCTNLSNVNLQQAKKLKKIEDFNGYRIGLELYVRTEIEVDDDPPYYRDLIQTEPGNWVNMDNYYMGTFEQTALSSIRLPDQVRFIAEDTFKKCSLLRSITFGKNFTGEINRHQKKRGTSAILYDLDLTSVSFAKGNPAYCVKDHVIYSLDGKRLCQVLESCKQQDFVLPAHINEIMDGAFANRQELTRVVVQGSLKRIGRSAFAGSQIRVFQIQGDIQQIGKGAFRYCRSLDTFLCEGTIGVIEEEAFLDCWNLNE